jgi:hypothetical protein
MNGFDTPSLVLFGITTILYGVVIYYLITILRRHMKVINSANFSVRTKAQMLLSIAIRTPPIHAIIYTLFSLFCLTWVSLLLAGSRWSQGFSGEPYMAFVTAISAPILGFCGQVQYIRNETPGSMWGISLQDPFAKLIGGCTMILGYGGAIISIIYGLILVTK